MPEPRRQLRPIAASPYLHRGDDWHDDALCREYPAHWWDDSLDGANESPVSRDLRHADAIAVCERCPVAAQCEADYDRSRDEGVRFGRRLPPLGPPSRVGSRGGRAREPIRHGSEAGYRAHLRRGDKLPPWDPCGCLSGANRAHERRTRQRAVCPQCGTEMARDYLPRHRRERHTEAS